MFNLGAGEVVVILLVALIVLGPTRLPEAARTVGRVMGELRRLSSGFQNEVRDAFQDVDNAPSPLDRRRTESKPLAATVEEADRGVAGATSTHGVAPDSPRRRAAAASAAGASANGSENGNGSGSGAAPADGGATATGDGGLTADRAGGPTEVVERSEVAPEVGEALDQISAAFPSSAAPAPGPADTVTDDDPQAP